MAAERKNPSEAKKGEIFKYGQYTYWLELHCSESSPIAWLLRESSQPGMLTVDLLYGENVRRPSPPYDPEYPLARYINPGSDWVTGPETSIRFMLTKNGWVNALRSEEQPIKLTDLTPENAAKEIQNLISYLKSTDVATLFPERLDKFAGKTLTAESKVIPDLYERSLNPLYNPNALADQKLIENEQNKELTIYHQFYEKTYQLIANSITYYSSQILPSSEKTKSLNELQELKKEVEDLKTTVKVQIDKKEDVLSRARSIHEIHEHFHSFCTQQIEDKIWRFKGKLYDDIHPTFGERLQGLTREKMGNENLKREYLRTGEPKDKLSQRAETEYLKKIQDSSKHTYIQSLAAIQDEIKLANKNYSEVEAEVRNLRVK